MRGLLFLIVSIGLSASILGGSMSASRTDADPRATRAVEDADAAEDMSGATSASYRSADGTIEIERSANGHFYVEVEINGAPIQALVDTGATGIALSRSDARAAGVATSIGMDQVVGQGADGDVRGEHAVLDSVTLGHLTVEGMPAIVLNSGEQTLLGQAILSKFESVEIRDNVMVLR